jgi:hypothetical protein
LSSNCLINTLLEKKGGIERWDDEEEDVSSNRMTLRKRYCKLKKEDLVAFHREITLEETIDLS